MTNSLNKDDDLLILSDNNSIDFWESLDEKKEDDFAFTIMEDDNPIIEEISSTKNELNDLLISTSNSTKNELSDLGDLLNISPEKTEDKNTLDFTWETIILDDKPILEESIQKLEDKTSNDLSGLLWEITTPKIEEKIISEEPKIEEKISFLDEDKKEENNSFSKVLNQEIENVKTEKKAEEKSISNNTFTEVKDISEILAWTIWQFVKRTEIINEEISEKISHIEILKSELTLEENLLSELETEKAAIEKNKIAIEKMKNDYENPVFEESKTKKTSK